MVSIHMMEGDGPRAEALTEDIIKLANEYYCGNEDNELIIDPYMFKAAFLMQASKFAEAQKATELLEKLIKN